ncbi:MAG: Asp-tRNA(Asn)/Glu-tRNA(Gln) amidotransferase subunit GatA [Bacteroidetes bacterium]|nr:MAG: Asp-tRNA(Asn)/Glu-tRNA(Gln) amidotransferase subunit GatA [Bacteroidota bacterium]
MNSPSFSEIQQPILSGKASCRQTVLDFLKQIEEKKNLNAFLEVFKDSALAKAEEVDKNIRKKKQGRLAGMVIAIKDNICYKDHKVSASSKILDNFTSLYSATVVERLLQEDAILIGRTNCDEFAMGSSNENSAFGNVLNPHDNSRVPGGSSGGSATAVAANLCHAALGSDTGGSIRQPASFCGVVGMKPTYGRVSRWGLIAYASSFDQIGPLTNTVEDAELILDVIQGADEYDSTCTQSPTPALPSREGVAGRGMARIAYLKDCVEHSGLNPEIKKRMEEIIAELKKQGHIVEPIDFPYLDYLVPAYYVLTTAEASSNLARFDGIRYGYQSKNATDLESTYRKSRSEGFGKEVKRRIMLGTFVLSSGYYDAYYSKAQKVRRVLRDKTNDILKKYDFILSPTTPGTAFKHGDVKDPIQMYLEDIFTVLANLTGMPAISLPLGKSSSGMPFGVQLMGKKFGEKELLEFSKTLMEKFVVSLQKEKNANN